jgi:tetratricopeptide (TPR) repeat protein
VLGIFQNGPQMAADRYSYLACLGWALLAGGGLARWSQPRSGHFTPTAQAGPALAAVTILAVLALLTWQQTRVWRDSVTLWTQALAVDPSSSIAAKNVGKGLLALGKVTEAHEHFARMLRESRTANRLFGFGWALDESGDAEAAARYYRAAVALSPNHARAWNNLGAIYAKRGEFREALDAFLRSLDNDPHLPAACANGRRVAQILAITHASLDRCGRPGP